MTTSLLPTQDELSAKIKDAYYHARDHGGTMHTAGDAAAQDVLTLFHKSLARIVAAINDGMPPADGTKDSNVTWERVGWIAARSIVQRQA